MSRRARAIVFGVLALVAAAVGASLIAGYGSQVAGGYGPLRAVVVLRQGLPVGTKIGPVEAGRSLAVRRVPERFVPAGSLSAPGDAIGLVLRGPAPGGSYLLAAQLAPPTRTSPRRRLGAGRRPVEITVSGADALFATGEEAHGRRLVDVVVTAEPDGPGPGRTYVGATAVPLLALGPGEDGATPGGTAAATLGLTRRQALRLIAAGSYARKLTLLPVR